MDKGFTPIPNPYIVGNPIEDRKMFFGRVDDFEFIERKVAGSKKGGMIVLCGSRRSGKTSILFQIRQGRLGEGYVPVLVDMQSITVTSDREFLEAIARAIDAELNGDGTLVDDDFLSRLAVNPLLAFNGFTARVDAALAGRALVLMFDEYELFESHIEKGRFTSDVLNLMIYWMENSKGVYFLFAGSDRLEERDPAYWDSFLGKALHRRVSFLRRPDAMRLIHDPVEGLVDYGEGVPEKIFDLTAGQPFYTQVLCQSIVDHLNEMGRREVSKEDVDEVVEEIIGNPLPQMIFSWSSLSPLEKTALSLIAEASDGDPGPVGADQLIDLAERERIGYIIDPNKLRETLERLFSADLLDKEQEEERYSFRMDLWRRWISRMHSIWQVLDEVAAEGIGPEEGLEPVRRGRKALTLFAVSAAIVITVLAVVYGYYVRKTGISGGYIQPADSTTLTVNAEPAGAQVFLDRTLIGESPVTGRVKAGRSYLRVSMAGYHDYADSVTLQKDTPADIDISLEEKTGSLRVVSRPAGAAVILDGTDTGLKTPAEFESLSVNSLHSVVLRLAGYYPREMSGIRAVYDSMVTVAHDFNRVVHPLTVITDPAGANILVDGQPRGRSPLSIEAIEQGRHAIKIFKDGYFDTSLTVDLPVSDNQVSVGLRLLPPGELVLEIMPYAELWIDGKLVERDAVNYRAKLLQGSYVIELKHPVYDDITETVKIVSGKETKRTYNLEKGKK